MQKETHATTPNVTKITTTVITAAQPAVHFV